MFFKLGGPALKVDLLGDTLKLDFLAILMFRLDLPPITHPKLKDSFGIRGLNY